MLAHAHAALSGDAAPLYTACLHSVPHDFLTIPGAVPPKLYLPPGADGWALPA